MPELMHVGSLIVDDVEDRSIVRRGGPPAHTLFGEPLAINAGTLCYFLPQLFLAQSKLRPRNRYAFTSCISRQRVRRTPVRRSIWPGCGDAGHHRPRRWRGGSRAGASGTSVEVGRAGGCLARIGAILGGGDEAQIDALGVFVEHVGLAFQIVDDVLNLRGFANDLKQRGEDLAEGKVTMPVAKAMNLLDAESRTWLWAAVSAGALPSRDRPGDRCAGGMWGAASV